MRGNKGMLGLNVREWTICLCRHCKIQSLSSLELLVFFPELVYSINHLLNKFNLRVSKSVLVGDIISMTSLTTRLTTGSTGLQVKLFTSGLQFINTMLCPSRQVNMDRCSHSSSKIGWARVNISILGIKAEVLSGSFLTESPTALIPLASLSKT